MPRQTKQKNLLDKEISLLQSFFSAEELFNKVNSKGIGIATVYRFLKDLEDKGEIHSYLCNNRKIYSRNKHSHIHFTCEKCNHVQHLSAKNVDFLHNLVNGEVCHFQIDVKGICKNCK